MTPFEWTKSCTGKLSPIFDVGNIELGGQQGVLSASMLRRDASPPHTRHQPVQDFVHQLLDVQRLYQFIFCSKVECKFRAHLGRTFMHCPKPLLQVLLLVLVLVLAKLVCGAAPQCTIKYPLWK